MRRQKEDKPAWRPGLAHSSSSSDHPPSAILLYVVQTDSVLKLLADMWVSILGEREHV